MTAHPCHHDYENPRRLGRANYVCRKCGEDISMDVLLIAEVEMAPIPSFQTLPAPTSFQTLPNPCNPDAHSSEPA